MLVAFKSGGTRGSEWQGGDVMLSFQVWCYSGNVTDCGPGGPGCDSRLCHSVVAPSPTGPGQPVPRSIPDRLGRAAVWRVLVLPPLVTFNTLPKPRVTPGHIPKCQETYHRAFTFDTTLR